MKSKKEIEDEYFKAVENPGVFPGMSYSDGVQNALRWVAEDDEPKPMEECSMLKLLEILMKRPVKPLGVEPVQNKESK